MVFSVALTFGQTRYRTTFEVSLVLMAAVMLDAIWSALRRGRQATPESDLPDPASDPDPDPSPGERLDEHALTS